MLYLLFVVKLRRDAEKNGKRGTAKPINNKVNLIDENNSNNAFLDPTLKKMP